MSFISYFEALDYESIGVSLLSSGSILILMLIFRKFGLDLIFKVLGALAKKTKSNIDDKLILIIKPPVKMLFTITMIFITYKVFDMTLLLSKTDILSIDKFILHVYRSSIVLFFYLIIYNSLGDSKLLFEEIKLLFDIKIDKLLVPFMSKVFKLIIMIICIAAVAAEWGFDVNGFVAGLGIGGLAFALAARDTLANAFGGAVLITEKPFTIGDWIAVGEAEGTVEDINFRSTKIRKFDKSVVTVPNSIVVISNIINYSRRNTRRITYDLKISMETPIDKIKIVIEEIDIMLVEHPGIDNETIFVNFNKFDTSSFNIFLYFFTTTSVWGEYLILAEDTNFKILEILEKNDVKLALPVQIIKVEKEA